MFFRGFWWRFLLTIVLVGALIAGGVALYQAGFGQGYAAGLSARTDGGAAPAPLAPYYGYAPLWFGWGFPFFHPFGIFLGIGFFFFVFFVIGGLFRFGGRRRWANGAYWGRHPYWDRPGENPPTSRAPKNPGDKETPPYV